MWFICKNINQRLKTRWNGFCHNYKHEIKTHRIHFACVCAGNLFCLYCSVSFFISSRHIWSSLIGFKWTVWSLCAMSERAIHCPFIHLDTTIWKWPAILYTRVPITSNFLEHTCALAVINSLVFLKKFHRNLICKLQSIMSYLIPSDNACVNEKIFIWVK